jgi:hypothetical protein
MAPLRPEDKVIVYSEVPPLGNEGISMAVLAHRIIASMGNNVSQLITRAASRKYPRAQIGANLTAPTLLSWDCASVGLSFLKGRARARMDAWLLHAWQRLAYRRPSGAPAVELIGLSGPHYHFLPRLRALARDLQLPYSVYVIDDYEVTAAHEGMVGHELARCRALIADCLRQAHRVFAICPGMAERLHSLYGITSQLLYPIADESSAPAALSPVNSRELLYVGSLGPAYLDTLLAVADLLATGAAPGWRLKIISRDHRTFARVFAGRPEVSARHDCDRDGLRAEVANTEAILIPYSFSERWKTTAETSFPSKFMDAVAAGKPIIIFAPAYASIIRHVREAGGAGAVETSTACGELLTHRPWATDQRWFDAYQALHQRHHTPAAARRALGWN